MTDQSPMNEPFRDSTRQFSEWLQSILDSGRQAEQLSDYLKMYPEFENEIRRVFAERGGREASEESLQPTVDSTVQSPNPAPVSAESESLVGKFLGRYRIDAFLGQGGFGEVWKGYDPELARVVAIKLARRDRNTQPEAIDRILAEARKAASLSHSNIVQVYDIANVDEGWVIVSEYIAGKPLSKRLREGPVPVGFAVSTVIDVARGLQHAHVRDLIHRDVKPGNILLREEGGAVLTDFGLAVTEKELVTEPDRVSGTIRFMSPEQARGESGGLDHRTDIFSLGLVLYTMLAGRLPYPESDTDSYIRAVGSRPPRPIRSIVEAVPPELERICMRALAFKAEDRFATCLDFVEDLERWLKLCPDSESTRVLPQPATLTASGRSKSLAVVVGALLASLLLILGTLSAWGFFADRPRPLLTQTIPGGSDPTPPERPDIPEADGAQQPDADGGEEPHFDLQKDGWTLLLLKEPEVFAWSPGEGRGKPVFNAKNQSFSAKSSYFRWVFRCEERQSGPFQMQARIGLEDWKGHVGLVWGIRQDPDEYETAKYLAYAVEYRQILDDPPKLIVREIHMPRASFDIVGVDKGKVLQEIPIDPPGKSEMLLEVDVAAYQLKVRWGSGPGWISVSTIDGSSWIPSGRTGIGMTGYGNNPRIRSFAIRSTAQ